MIQVLFVLLGVHMQDEKDIRIWKNGSRKVEHINRIYCCRKTWGKLEQVPGPASFDKEARGNTNTDWFLKLYLSYLKTYIQWETYFQFLFGQERTPISKWKTLLQNLLFFAEHQKSTKLTFLNSWSKAYLVRGSVAYFDIYDMKHYFIQSLVLKFQKRRLKLIDL